MQYQTQHQVSKQEPWAPRAIHMHWALKKLQTKMNNRGQPEHTQEPGGIRHVRSRCEQT